MPQQGASTSLCHQADLKDIRSFSKVDDARDVEEIEITMAPQENHFLRASGEDQAQQLLQVLHRDGLSVDGERTVPVYADNNVMALRDSKGLGRCWLWHDRR